MEKLNFHEQHAVVNASFQHPFTCIVCGPSGSGKTTFVKNLLTAPEHLNLLDTKFAHISVYIGTRLNDNPIFVELLEKFGPKVLRVVEFGGLYEGNEKKLQENFAKDFVSEMIQLGPNGCVIFDDLMQELSNANILADLFSKHSSHLGLSVLHLTQNIFHSGKKQTEHRTVYINSHHLVLFKNSLDSTVFSTLAKRLSGGSTKKYRSTLALMEYATDKHRYIVVNANLKRDNRAKFTSDIFNTHPFPFQRVFIPES
jgi:septin family protein